MTVEIDDLSFTGSEINPAIFEREDSVEPVMETAQKDKAAKKRRAQVWQQQHIGTSHTRPKPNLEKLGRESSRKIKPPPKPH